MPWPQLPALLPPASGGSSRGRSRGPSSQRCCRRPASAAAAGAAAGPAPAPRCPTSHVCPPTHATPSGRAKHCAAGGRPRLGLSQQHPGVAAATGQGAPAAATQQHGPVPRLPAKVWPARSPSQAMHSVVGAGHAKCMRSRVPYWPCLVHRSVGMGRADARREAGLHARRGAAECAECDL
jgi:hypothetical protein